MNNRVILLDTETTGLSPAHGDRVIELGCVELVGRALTGRTFHQYFNPQGREINVDAQAVHGISAAQLADKQPFGAHAKDFIDFARGATVVIHNAPFDLGFLNAEFERCGLKSFKAETACTVVDTLVLAKNQFPGKRNSLDGLCDRFGVNRSNRSVHGALLDARLLSDVYLGLTRSQESLGIGLQGVSLKGLEQTLDLSQLRAFLPDATHIAAQEAYLDQLEKDAKKPSLWRKALAV